MSRTDLYSLPHKALRTAMAHAGTLLSATDPGRVGADLVVVRTVLADLRGHAAHEDEFIHPLLARVAPAVDAELVAQHADLDAVLDDLDRIVDDVQARSERGTLAPEHLVDLHRAHQRMVARNLVHLDHEETVAMPALWARASEVSLGELMGRFRAAHPEAGQLYQRWPAGLTATERELVGVAT